MSSTHWNDPPHVSGQGKTAAGWREVDNGLKRVLLGYTVIAAGLLLAVTLHGLAAGGLLGPPRQLVRADKEEVFWPVLLALGLGGLGGYLLVLAGQWRCLSCAPSHVEARDTMFAGVACLIVGAVLMAASLLVGGGQNGVAVLRGWGGVDRLDFAALAGLMQLGGAALMLLSFFCFNHFLRNVSADQHDPAVGIDPFLLYFVLLLGCSVGTCLQLQHLPWKTQAMLALAGGWVVCLLWHVQRIDHARKRIAEILCTARPGLPTRLLITPRGVPAALSGVRRVLKAMKK